MEGATGQVQRLLKKTLRRARIEAARNGNQKMVDWFFAAEKRSTRDNIVSLSRHEAEVQVRVADLDANPMLLNCANGTVDLSTGNLRSHQRKDLLTKLAPFAYDSDARCPLWETFIKRIFGEDRELIAFVKKAVGYSLTGDVGEQVLFVLWGCGANGKSTFLVTLLSLLGEYGKPGVSSLLLARKYEQHPTELADLFGARFVAFQEATEGQRFDESKVKALTGGDRIEARRMREDFWHYSPTHKLWLGTNHRPIIRGTDLAIWRRILLIPFDVTIPPSERDKKLPAKLKGECPGILRWAVEGSLEWQRGGLASPKRVQAAVEEYRQLEDRLGAFVADCCVLGANVRTKSADLYAAFKLWAETNGEPSLSAKAFGQRLSERGFQPISIGHDKGRGWKGIGLRTHADVSSRSSLVCARVENNPANESASVRTRPPSDRTGHHAREPEP